MPSLKSLGAIAICAKWQRSFPSSMPAENEPAAKILCDQPWRSAWVPLSAAAGINNIGWIAGDALATANPDKIYFRWL